MSFPVLVLPSQSAWGLNHDPSEPHVDREGAPIEVCSWPLVSLERALREPWDTDAHAVSYLIPGEKGEPEDPCPRINQGALPWLSAQGTAPVVVRVVVDCDTPGHVPWAELGVTGEAWWTDALGALGSRPELAGAAWYHTRAGYRLWWELERPVPASRWHPYISRFIEHLRAVGVSADPLADWTRLMRLPRVTRDGETVDLPRSGNLPGLLRWEPSATLTQVPSGGSSSAPRVPRGTPRPEPSPVTDDEWAMLVRRRVPAPVVAALKEGAPLAQPPESRRDGAPGRNQVTLSTAGVISRAFGALDPSLLYRYLRASVEAQGEPSLDVLWDRCLYVVSRASEPSTAPPAPPRPALALVPSPSEEATPLPAPAAEQITADVADLSLVGARARRVLLTTEDARGFWILDERASRPGREVYHGPVASTLVVPSIERWAPTLGGRLRTEGGNPRPVVRILADCGWQVRQAELVAGVDATVYDPETEVIACAAAPWRPGLEPRQDPRIARWLALVGGDHVEDLLDWLATFRRLDRPTCGLYIHAPKGLGKQLLASGLARLYASGTAVPYEVLEADFHDDLLRSLFIWADEVVPRNRRGATPSATFRQVVANGARRVNRKGLPVLYLRGFPRLLITANNPDVFALGDEDLTPEDLDAIIERVGYIRAGPEAGDYLAHLGGFVATRPWVDGDLLARHVLWLERERAVEGGTRFLVPGWRSEMHDRISQSAGLTQLLLTALATALADMRQWGATGAIQIKEGELYANQSELKKLWSRLVPDARPVHAHRLMKALRTLARPWAGGEGALTRQIRHGNSVLSYWHIDEGSVLRAAESLQIGDADALRGALKVSQKTG